MKTRWIALWIAAATILCVSRPAIGAETISPGLGVQYDHGINSSLAVNANNIVVEVHESQNENTIWYHVGRASGFGIDWAESEYLGDAAFQSGGIYHSKGQTPSVAVTDDNFVIVVYRHDYDCGTPCIRPDSDLYYRVGRIDPDTLGVDWDTRHRYSNETCEWFSCSGGGVTPSIAVNGHGQLIEVHESAQSSTQLYYRLGQIDAEGNVTWDSAHRIGDQGGNFPEVSINDDGVVVEVHEAGFWNFDLWSNTGVIENGLVSWKKNQQYDTGSAPSVSINDNGVVFESHKSESAFTDNLWTTEFRIGPDFRLERTRGPRRFENGAEPDIAANDDLVAITHAEGVFDYGLASTASLITDRARWMELTPGVLERQLWQVTMPGSHDAGMYDVALQVINGVSSPIIGPDNEIPVALQATAAGRWVVWDGAQTQYLDFRQQLEQGVRYFDLRASFFTPTAQTCPVELPGTYYAAHQVLGPQIVDVLDDVYDYMVSLGPDGRELVIIALSHLYPADCFPHDDFLDLLLSHPLEQFYLRQPAGNLFTRTLGELVANGPRVIVTYSESDADGMTENGIWRSVGPSFTNSYTNTVDYGKMKNNPCPPVDDDERCGQLGRLETKHAGPNQLFGLSWTLTFPTEFVSEMITEFGNLHNLTTRANRYLGAVVNNAGREHKINIVFVDFPEDARAADVAIELNRHFPVVDVALSGDPDVIVESPGTEFVVSFQVSNAGGETAEDVWLYAALPDRVNLVSAVPDDPTTMSCDTNGLNLACELGDIAFPNAVNVDLTLSADSDIRVTLEVEARSAWADDPDYDNNAFSTRVNVRELRPRPQHNGGAAGLWLLGILGLLCLWRAARA